MNEHDTISQPELHWSDSMDDGSLTLEAEWVLTTLPKQLLPRLTCLLAPDLLNRLIQGWGKQYAQLAQDGSSPIGLAPTDQAGVLLQLPEDLSIQHLGEHAVEVRAELQNLCRWLNLMVNLRAEQGRNLAAA